MSYKFYLKMLIEIYNGEHIKTTELTKERKDNIRKVLENKEEFIRFWKKQNGIREGEDVFKIIKEKYNDKEDYFYPSQREQEEKRLMKDFEELLKDKWDYIKQIKVVK